MRQRMLCLVILVSFSLHGCGLIHSIFYSDTKGILRGDDCQAPGLEWMEAVEGYDKQEVIDLAAKFEAAAKADAELLKGLKDGSTEISITSSLKEIIHNTSGRSVKVSQAFFEKASTYRTSICNIERWLRDGTFSDPSVRASAQMRLLSLSQNFASIVSSEKQTTNVISINQSGGITAQTVNVNGVVEPEWLIGASERMSENEWRTKLSARGRGNLPYYNWNVLLTLNTPVIKREDVSGEVTVGPWMPLSTTGGQLTANQFFIGFSEFKPGQAFAIYLYSKEPITVLRVDVIPERR